MSVARGLVRGMLLAAAGLGAWACGGSSPSPRAEDRFLVVTEDPGGRLRAFDPSTGVERSEDLVVVEDPTALGQPRALLDAHVIDADGRAYAIPGPSVGVALSPDGRLLARFDPGPDGQMKVGRLGEEPRAVGEGAPLFAWEPTGEALILVDVRPAGGPDAGLRELVRLALDDGSRRVLATLEGRVTAPPVPAPDGSWWLLRAGEAGERGPAILRVSPEGAVRVVHETARLRKILSPPLASPGSELVAFISSADNDCRAGEVWVADLEGSGVRRTTKVRCRYLDPDRGLDPKLVLRLPDGRILAMGSGRDECEPRLGASAFRCHDEIYVADVEGGELRRVSDLDLHFGAGTRMVALSRP